MADDATTNDTTMIELAAELTAAWLANANTRANSEDVPAFLKSMHASLLELGGDAGTASADQDAGEVHEPAVSVRKSLASKDHIISMIDGKPYKTLKRHLSKHGLTPEQYRQRYNLKADYPMTSSSYSEARRSMAKSLGLGRKPKAATEAKPAAPKRARKAPAAAE